MQRLHISFDDVVPLQPQVYEGPGPELVSPPVQDVVSGGLVLHRWNQSKRNKSTGLSRSLHANIKAQQGSGRTAAEHVNLHALQSVSL